MSSEKIAGKKSPPKPKVNLTCYDIYEAGGYSSMLFDCLLMKRDTRWGTVKFYLDCLSKYFDVKGLGKSVGLSAKASYQTISKIYKKDDESLKPTDIEFLKTVIKQWEIQLENDSMRWVVCFPETNLNLDKLKEGARSFLIGDAWAMLSQFEQAGLDEATSCLLSNNFTSAEFIALRTVESLLRRWYEKKTGKAVEDTTFGQVLKKLDEEFPEKTRPKEISALYYFKERRNAIAHPDVISNAEETAMTFLQVISQCKALQSTLSP